MSATPVGVVMGIARVLDQIDRPTVASGGGQPTGAGGSEWVMAVTGASRRQLHYWLRKGLLGPEHVAVGSGHRHRYSAHDVEVLQTLVQLAALGATEDWLTIAARAVRAGRVNPAGERLVLLLDGTCYRHPADQPIAAKGPAWVVPLEPCSFSPAGDPPVSTAASPAGSSSRGAA